MIALLLREVPFEQDIRELFMAYFPGEAYTHDACEEASLTLRGSLPDDAEGYVFELDARGGATFTGSARICDDRFDTKCGVKLAVYHMLEAYTGRRLPWGTLTGIRPTRLFLDMLDAGMDEQTASEGFAEKFDIGDEKLNLCRRVAVRERSLLAGTDRTGGWSLYIGIPFCPTTCLYCSFTSYPIGMWQKRTDEYVDALIQDIRQTSRIYSDKKLETVYMGGGTPTSLEADQLSRILDAVAECNDLSDLRELTVEAGRPDSITRDKLAALSRRGCSRISVNPQTMQDRTLKIIGRLHSVDMVREKYYLARECGFDNINMDLIAGLPGEGEQEMTDTMDRIKELAPESVTVHTLAIKHKARLNRESESYGSTDTDTVAAMLHVADSACADMGLEPYYMYRQKNMAGNFENIGYSAPGRECLYNVLIMEERQIIAGCGAGTSTKIPLERGKGVERSAKVRDPGLYIERYRADSDR